MSERIEKLCADLSLTAVAHHYGTIAQEAATKEMSHLRFLGQFDFDAAPGVPKARIQELSGLAFVERRENVILLGPSGVGKTHLAIALALKATERSCKVRFITAADLTLQLEKARREDRLDQYLRRAILGPRLLVLDEIGYLPRQQHQADVFFQVVCQRRTSLSGFPRDTMFPVLGVSGFRAGCRGRGQASSSSSSAGTSMGLRASSPA